MSQAVDAAPSPEIVRVLADGCMVAVNERFIDRDGYMLVKFGSKQGHLHRLLGELIGGRPAIGRVFRHTCNRRNCINPAHLLLGTQAENMRDRAAAGNDPIGEKNGRAIFTEDQVREMRANPEVPDSIYADRWGASLTAVRSARRGKNWKHV